MHMHMKQISKNQEKKNNLISSVKNYLVLSLPYSNRVSYHILMKINISKKEDNVNSTQTNPYKNYKLKMNNSNYQIMIY
jgi:hypothetical protein